MCLELCQNISSDRFHCEHISGEGKKVIYFARDANTKLVLKTKTLNPLELQLAHQTLLKDTLTYESVTATTIFLRRISHDLFTNNETLDRFLSHIDMDNHNTVAAVASGESLLHQEEYVTINNLQSTGIVPKLYGTCGNFYAVDYIPTDSSLVSNNLFSGWPWTSIGKLSNKHSLCQM